MDQLASLGSAAGAAVMRGRRAQDKALFAGLMFDEAALEVARRSIDEGVRRPADSHLRMCRLLEEILDEELEYAGGPDGSRGWLND